MCIAKNISNSIVSMDNIQLCADHRLYLVFDITNVKCM